MSGGMPESRCASRWKAIRSARILVRSRFLRDRAWSHSAHLVRSIECRAESATRCQMVANVSAAHPEDDIFGDIGSVIANPLQVPRNQQHVQGLLRVRRLVFNASRQCTEDGAIQFV